MPVNSEVNRHPPGGGRSKAEEAAFRLRFLWRQPQVSQTDSAVNAGHALQRLLHVLREFKTRDQNVLTKVTKPVIEFGSYFAMVCVLLSTQTIAKYE